MPYITSERKSALLDGDLAATSGELNYLLTKVCQGYLANHTRNYAYLNDCIGALEACKLELYRRIVVPYEDEKIIANGDVW